MSAIAAHCHEHHAGWEAYSSLMLDSSGHCGERGVKRGSGQVGQGIGDH